MTLNTSARAGLAGTAALVALALCGSSSAQAATSPEVGAASYLVSQLAAGDHHLSTTYDGTAYADYGLTDDAILALAAGGAGQTEMNRAADYMVANGSAYYGAGTERYSGSLAKQIVMLKATGRSTGALVTDLQGLEAGSGRFSDKSEYGDYSNNISQSWALIALKRSGVNPSANAVAFLKSQQCSDGGFKLKPDDTGCVSDPDVTSFAVQTLAAVGDSAAATRGADYLAGKQQTSGGVGGGSSTSGVNSNSTGLAAVAFSVTGKAANASRATAYVKSLQFGCDAPAALRGAIAYDRATYTAKLAAGAPDDQENRSTVQAVLGLTLQPYVAVTAHGTADATIDCGTTSTSTTTTSSTSSSTSTSTATSTTTAPSATSSSSVVTGPAVVTDGPTTDGGADLGVLAGAGALLATVAAGAGMYGRRRK